VRDASDFSNPKDLLADARRRLEKTSREFSRMGSTEWQSLGPPELAGSAPASDPFALARGKLTTAMNLRLPDGQAGEMGGPGIQPIVRSYQGQGFDVRVFFTPKLSYCLAHAGRHIVDLDLTGRFPKPTGDLTVAVRIDPALSAVWKRTVPAPEIGLDVRIGPVELALHAEQLAALTEARPGSLALSISDGTGRELFAATESIEVLAHNEWVAVPGRIDLLATFVMPNDSAVMEILKRVRTRLAALGVADSLEGYQDPVSMHDGHSRPWMIARAVYDALRGDLGISYINPPASFETTGQKILLPSQILEHRMGTCLDLAVLYAACLERAGLHSLLFIMHGHAFAGFWQKPTALPTPVEQHWMSVKQALQAGLLVPVETTGVTGASTDFDQAIAAGRHHIEAGSTLEIAVDIARARIAKVKPMDAGAAGGLPRAGS